jgi:hypothetical protein
VPTPNIQVILQTAVAVMNNLVSPQVQVVNLDLGNPTLPSAGVGGTSVFYDPYFQAPIAGATVALPATKVFCIIVQNLSLTAQLTVEVTPFGGVAQFVNYGPGGVCILFDPSEAGTGFSGLTLLGVGGIVPAMVLVAV